MRAYKYMTSTGGVRFLKNWSLRVTPPADFNDPFELRPSVERVLTEEHVDARFQVDAPQMLVEELTKLLTSVFGAVLTQQDISDMVTCMLGQPDVSTQIRFLKNIERKIPGFASADFIELQKQIKLQLPVLLLSA